MANTYTCLYYHVIFSTKRRERWITRDIEQRVWAYLGGIACQNNLKPLLIGGVDDHVHMLLSMPPSISVSEAIKRIKGGSSGWVKDNFHGLKGFGWQDGYGAFTVSKTQIPEVDEYIRNQREHHRLKTFQEEYRAFLDKHEIEYDERYLWD
ncbi:MAG: IS200/IS605 family transposase [Verrucomicrobiota bacterium]|jgi:REP element-mobilizing transposase RayT